ncbi:winged helix-turn-helix transcriptional regulator [Nocardioides sp.]|uniref:winged helix-turn-helix transcriptional regulator n=1 Tax=Nocardioides sp. TaxID=35761 RepID=UPI0039E42470
MPATDVRTCSVARALDVIGERWSLLVVRELFLGSRRFEEFARYTGAPRDVLTTRLRKLEEAGLIRREPYQDRPVRFEYRLTDLGKSLHPVIHVLREWGDAHLAGDDGPPTTFRHSCGEVFHPVLTCAACGEPAGPRDVSRG